IELAVASAAVYHLDRSEAQAIADRQVQIVSDTWRDVADHSRLTRSQTEQLWGTSILNPAIFWPVP
ncbi:MAG: type II toxin-antitoxin system HipA family toxin, partial [Actinomycetota bacterium]|nr:type II toxin-antitoxin system HipA family toxin [Actinomycetota bacterium]